MRFHALGPIAVQRDGAPMDLGPRKQRALLALLLIHANQLLSVERILEALWGNEGEGKEKALRVHVSRLRSALEPDRARGDSSVLETFGAAYRLNVHSDQFDVTTFGQRAAEGRRLLNSDPGPASEILESALSLWTGGAFEDFAYEEFAQLEIGRLNEARVDALEDRIEANLAQGQAGEVVSELEVLRDQHPLRERLVRHQALALYRAGRAADALRAIDRFRRQVGDELGIEPSPLLLRLEEQVLLHDQSIQPRRSASGDLEKPKSQVSNPFKGLRAFGTDDAASFFGRDALVAELLRSIGGGQRLVSLVGASGSGKSSVIRAGLIPALAKGAIEGSDSWLVASMMPGGHPFAELEAALLRSTIDAPPSLSEQLEDPSAGILRAVLRVLPDEGAHLVLVIDQFEELFTMVDADVRQRFLAGLVTSIDDPKARLTVVVTLRADFYEKPLQHPEFGARLGRGIINATPLTAEELGDAAVLPAQEAGVDFDASLLGQLIADVGNQPGGLPLFQYALTELFDRRSGDTLLLSTYRAMGGIEGAIQRRADEVYESLAGDEKDAARQLLLRLVMVGEHGQRSRRRVEAREIASLGVDTVTMQSTIAQLGEHRLLSFDSDRLSGAPTVEVAHESLLTAWSMLGDWIEESREDIRRHGALVIALREWQLADRNPDYLLSVARLAECRDWERTSNLRLNDQERGYVDASAARLAAEEADREADERRAAKGRRRVWALVAVLGGSLAITVLFLAGVFAPDPGPTISFFGQQNPDRVSDSIKLGVDRAEADLDMVLNDVRWTVDLVTEFEEFAQSDPGSVIPDSSLYFESQIFYDYPDIRFAVTDPGDQNYTSLPNVSFVNFRNAEGAFLAGVAAAATTETGVVGFVGGARVQLIEDFRAGFEEGVEAVDPDVAVLATFVSTGADGFSSPDGADVRATALYERGADVVFHAAGLSGQGIFSAADRYSETNGSHVWGIGVDVDQWFDVSIEHRDHVLTSMIKRQDVAGYILAEHLINDGPAGLVDELGLAESGYDYVTTGDSLPAEVIAMLDHFIEEVSAGRITVPTTPAGEILRFDASGNEVKGVPNQELFGPDLDASVTLSADDLEGIWTSEATPFKLRLNSNGTYEAALTEEGLDTAPAEWGEWTLDGAEFVFDTHHSDCPGALDRPARYRIRWMQDETGAIAFDEIDDPCVFRTESMISEPWHSQ